MGSPYRCPLCHMASRSKDITKKVGHETQRKITYECGTELNVYQTGFSFKEKIIKHPKCGTGKLPPLG